MKNLAISLSVAGMLGVNWLAFPAVSAEPEVPTGTEAGNFQIMKATADKVWRLNRNSGEISVCSLDGERLVCTSSTEAIRPPSITYEERKAERKRLDDEQQAKDMEFLDRALAAIRSIFSASQNRANEAPQ